MWRIALVALSAFPVVILLAIWALGSDGKARANLLGDVNCDGRVNSVDALMVLQFDAGIVTSLPCPQNGDVNGDGRISSLDASLILQLDAGIIPGFGAVPTPTPPTQQSSELIDCLNALRDYTQSSSVFYQSGLHVQNWCSLPILGQPSELNDCLQALVDFDIESSLRYHDILHVDAWCFLPISGEPSQVNNLLQTVVDYDRLSFGAVPTPTPPLVRPPPLPSPPPSPAPETQVINCLNALAGITQADSSLLYMWCPLPIGESLELNACLLALVQFVNTSSLFFHNPVYIGTRICPLPMPGASSQVNELLAIVVGADRVLLQSP